jgi:uncharacterized protein (DUF924 family)
MFPLRFCAPEEYMNDRTNFLGLALLATTTWLGVASLVVVDFAQAAPNPARAAASMSVPAPVTTLAANREAREVVAFWRDAGPALWFAKDPKFDARFRERFLLDHEAAARGELMQWLSTPESALALVLLLDQFPRNAFRGTARMYDTDAMARKVANTAFAAGYDQKVPIEMRKFFVLPFGHSEDLADQERAVALARRLGPDDLAHSEHHLDIVRRFGRFPHRNVILIRVNTREEQRYLDNGGFAG